MFSRIRRPLIVFTPKSLLRSKAATSPVTDFTSGHFRAVIGDTTADPAAVRKVLLCSGKIYYDLVAERTKLGTTDTAIVRIERPYPVPVRTLPEAIAPYPNAELRWVQEEPANQGAWQFVSMNFPQVAGRTIVGITRPSSSSPAVGSHSRHEREQRALIDAAFA